MAIFPKRTLPDHAVSISNSELVVGEAYYRVSFFDRGSLIPELKPMIFIGKGIGRFGKNKFVFQDPSSYLRGITPEEASPEKPVELSVLTNKNLSGAYAFDAALDVLLSCSLRRRK